VKASQALAHPLDRRLRGHGGKHGVVVEYGQRGHGRARYAGATVNRRPKLSIVAPTAGPEETAAVVAALERFMRETAPPPAPPAPRRNPWQRAGLHEGVTRAPDEPAPWS
jgi:hypothetical protein